MSLTHFILIYDHAQQKLVETLDFGSRGTAAAATYGELEQKYREQKGIEIVLVGADSLETIRSTHAHYFSESAADPFETLVGA